MNARQLLLIATTLTTLSCNAAIAQANTSASATKTAKVEAPAGWGKISPTMKAYLAEKLCKSQFPLDPDLKHFAGQSWNDFYDNNLSGCDVTKEQIDAVLNPAVEKAKVVEQEPAPAKKAAATKQKPVVEPEVDGEPELDPRAAGKEARSRVVGGDLDSMILQRTNQLFGEVPENATFHRAKVTRKGEVPESGCRVISSKHVPGKGTYKRWKC
jgi:hypothetical protein